MTFKVNSYGAWAGGRARPSIFRSLGGFTIYRQLELALLRPGIAEGVTATLVGVDGLEIATFERQLDPLLQPEVRLYGQHIHADRILEESFTVGALGSGSDIEVIQINGGGTAAASEGVGVVVTGSVHIICRFAGYFRGPGFYVSAQALNSMTAPGNGAYLGAGFQYNSAADALCGGVGKLPAGWYRSPLVGAPSSPLAVTGVAFVQLKVAAPLATPEEWQHHLETFRGAGDLGSLVCGSWRADGSDATATWNFANQGADYGLSNEDRQLMLVSYAAGGSESTTWKHIHVSDADKEVTP